MRTSFRLTGVTLVLFAALASSGCAPGPSNGHTTPKPSPTALFATDAEALAAAEEAYAAYLATSDEITAEGGSSPERIDQLVAPALQSEVHSSLKKFQDRQLHTDGVSKFDSQSLQSQGKNDDGSTSVDIYLCLDLSDVRVISSTGEDVTPPDRQNRLPLSVGFTMTSDSVALLLERSDSWSGTNFCE